MFIFWITRRDTESHQKEKISIIFSRMDNMVYTKSRTFQWKSRQAIQNSDLRMTPYIVSEICRYDKSADQIEVIWFHLKSFVSAVCI